MVKREKSVLMPMKLRTNPYAKILLGIVLLAAGALSKVCAQEDIRVKADKPTVPAFSVVSIKVNKDGGPLGGFRPTDDGITYINTSLFAVIRSAYGMGNSPEKQFIGLPEWAKFTRFDLVAKIDEADLTAWKMLMLTQRVSAFRKVLEERFKMKAHQETKELPVYALVVDKGGPRIKEVAVEDLSGKSPTVTARPFAPAPAGFRLCGRLTLNKMPMGALASSLSSITGRTVLDKTQLTGMYSFQEFYRPAVGYNGPNQPEECDAPTVFEVLKTQLGLRLDSQTAPVPVLEIDHLEMPTEN